MNNAPISSRCPRCGAEISANSVQGLCPRCLLAASLGAETNVTNDATRASTPPTEPKSLEDVASLFPQLEILRLIGRGGMGAVYQARQPALDRFVALKLLTPPTTDIHGFAERFIREAKALARLSHANIVTVHDFGERQGHYFLLMEFVDGVNLRELLQQKTITPAQALAIVPKLCEALQFAHEQGIVHRDIKPENILIDKRGLVKLADFGIAKIITANTPTTKNLTNAQDRMGTPHYMAPEQVESSKSVDHRADIYSLGVVFYELLTGELPLGRFAPPSQKVQIDVRLDEVVLRALEKEPARRFQHAVDVKTEVDTIVATPNDSPKSKHVAKRHWPWIAATLALGLAAIITTTILLIRPRSEAQQPVPPTVTLENAEPVVVRTWPASGATDIEPGEIEISATFSKPMSAGYSWTKFWDNSVPEGLSVPEFSKDRRTCSLKVLASPGRTYAILLNAGDTYGGRYNNFRDASGTAAIPYLLSFTTKSDPPTSFDPHEMVSGPAKQQP